jgi:hypothetical protein
VAALDWQRLFPPRIVAQEKEGKMNRRTVLAAMAVGLMGAGCATFQRNDRAGSFGSDLAFLKEHTDVVVLTDLEKRAQVAVVPLYQGRVMTSTGGGRRGLSYGWLNRDLIAKNERQEHMNVFGGEDRFWLGPEGGQYSIFFKSGVPFDLPHWQTPEPIDWGGWETGERTDTHVYFHKDMVLTNYSGAVFALRADRVVRLMTREEAQQRFRMRVAPAISLVAYESNNRITNSGERPWEKDTGLLSIWILGMFNPSEATTIVIPFRTGAEEEHGPVVNDAYFGKVPEDRLKIGDGVMFFRGDGRYRSKIGVSPKRARPVVGSYDAVNGVLTLVQYTRQRDMEDFVNSMWEIQANPYGGDVVNSYNDGPLGPGQPPLGPFYELETSSAAAALAPGATMRHIHRTVHIQGTAQQLDPLARVTLGVGLDEIQAAFVPAADRPPEKTP